MNLNIYQNSIFDVKLALKARRDLGAGIQPVPAQDK